MECNICGNDEFIDMNSRKAVRCSKCNSLERTRVIALFIKYYKLINNNTRVLHIAPEQGLADYLHGIAGDNCNFVDLEPENYSFVKNIKKMDLCYDLESISDESFDLIVHSHVMEHLPCNYTYVLHHLNRIMKTDGSMVWSIPFTSGFYDCCTSPSLSDEERVLRFGQDDHVRRFGVSDLQMSLGKIYNLHDEYDITKYFPVDELRAYNIPENIWKGYSASAVLCSKKEDYLLK
jgi:phosphoglycolate phosphatase